MVASRDEGLRDHLLARTAFVDRAVLDALAGGVRHVVVVGAGYDDRAWRFRTPGVRFFEVDHPDTQRDKRIRLEGLRLSGDVTLVPADLREPGLPARLAAAGHDALIPTLFVLEGLLVYLDEPVIRRLLDDLAGCAAPGSRLTASLAIHADAVDSARAVDAANARRRSATAEPWRTIRSRAGHLRLLVESGWRPVVEVDGPSVSGRGVSLLVDAVTSMQ
jgi:methyltransferase (TIGR00027 family)